ncbi:MAG: hypothetical protein ACRDT0_24195 [Pseudonocardiaceae bacterium]
MTEALPVEVHVRRGEGGGSVVEIQEWGLVADQPEGATVQETAQQLLAGYFGMPLSIARQVRLRVTVDPDRGRP